MMEQNIDFANFYTCSLIKQIKDIGLKNNKLIYIIKYEQNFNKKLLIPYNILYELLSDIAYKNCNNHLNISYYFWDINYILSNNIINNNITYYNNIEECNNVLNYINEINKEISNIFFDNKYIVLTISLDSFRNITKEQINFINERIYEEFSNEIRF